MDAGQPSSLADDAGRDGINRKTGTSSLDPIPVVASLDRQIEGVIRQTLRTKHRQVHSSKSAGSGIPRRPVPAFILFSAEKRREIQEKEPNLKFPEVTKKLSELWSTLSKEEKEPYQQASQQSKDRYTQELREFGRKRSQEKVSNDTPPTKRFKESTLRKEPTDVTTTKNDSLLKPKKKRGRPPKVQQQQQQRTASVVEEPIIADSAIPLSVVPITKSLSQRGGLPPVFVPDTDIPIFTDKFLQHNKDLDRDLWQLRRTNKMTQEGNELLQRSIDDLQASIKQLQERIAKTEQKNSEAEQRLEQIKSIITKVFSDSYLPEKLTEPTVEEFLKKLAGSDNAHIQAAVRTVKHEIAKFATR